MKEEEEEVLYTGLTLQDAREAHPLKTPEPGDPRPLITTRFEITADDLDPLECSKLLELEPTASAAIPQVKGKWFPSGRPHVVRPYWKLGFNKEPGDDINDGLSRLLDLLWPHREAVLQLTARPGYTAGFLTSVSIFEDRPVYGLGPETLRRLGFFGLPWGFDIFDYRG